MVHVECTCGDGRCMLCDDNGMQKHIAISSSPDKNWANDDIQFPRLIAEIYSSVSLTDEQMEALCDSMDLSTEEILEIMRRAEATWESIKEKTRPI